MLGRCGIMLGLQYEHSIRASSALHGFSGGPLHNVPALVYGVADVG
jgi:hypothetical protein